MSKSELDRAFDDFHTTNQVAPDWTVDSSGDCPRLERLAQGRRPSGAGIDVHRGASNTPMTLCTHRRRRAGHGRAVRLRSQAPARYERFVQRAAARAREPDTRFRGLRHPRPGNARHGRFRGPALRGTIGLRVPIIVYTGTGDYDRCAQAIRLGAYSFIDKAEPMERVAQEVENAIERRRLTAEVTLLRHGSGSNRRSLARAPRSRSSRKRSYASRRCPVRCWWSARVDGKELVARELHRLGANPRAHSSRSTAQRYRTSW